MSPKVAGLGLGDALLRQVVIWRLVGLIDVIQPKLSPELIELERVLAGPRFANSPRLSKFLAFIVKHALAGESAILKESVIAMEVYERGSDYDPSKDSTVRAEASRLRRALAEYYAGLDTPSPLRIEVPKGSYVPIFVIHKPVSQAVPPARRRQKLWLFALATTLLIAALGLLLWPAPYSTTRPEAVRLLVQASDALSVRRTVPQAGVPPEVRDALRLFQASTEADPSYAAAWAGLARSRYEAARSDRPGLLAWIDLSRQAAQMATRLDHAQPVGLTVLARIAYSIDFDLLTAEKLYRQGVPLDPRDDEASEEFVDLLGQLGKSAEAKTLVANHLSLAPQHQHWRIQEAKLLLQAGRIEDAEQQIAKAILADPRQIAFTTVLNGRGSWRYSKAGAAAKYSEQVLVNNPWSRGALQNVGMRAAAERNMPEVRRVIQRLHERMDLGHSAELTLANIYETLGEHAQALHWLDQAVRYRDPSIVFVTPRDIAPDNWIKLAERNGELAGLLREFPQWAKLLKTKY